jgi:hypothetical protein
VNLDDRRTAEIVVDALASVDATGVPGRGGTGRRWTGLYDLAAREDVSVARLCEAHVDACAILAEAGATPVPGALYGVWASVAPGSDLELRDGVVGGVKTFCSGIGIVDRALIDVIADGRRQLVDVGVGLDADGDAWRSPDGVSSGTVEWANFGLRGTQTGTVTLTDVTDVVTVGEPDWYLRRVGFWHGACGPAACWGGGAAGLLAYASNGEDPFRSAAAGEIAAAVWAMRAVLQQAGDEADEAPDDLVGARRRARAVRHTIHELATSVIDTFLRAYGPRPLVEPNGAAQRVADVQIYLRQHHDRRDLAALGDDLTPGELTPRQ